MLVVIVRAGSSCPEIDASFFLVGGKRSECRIWFPEADSVSVKLEFDGQCFTACGRYERVGMEEKHGV